MMAAYYGRNLDLFEKLSGKFLDLIRLEDRILGFCPDFTLENWIQASRSVLAGADERQVHRLGNRLIGLVSLHGRLGVFPENLFRQHFQAIPGSGVLWRVLHAPGGRGFSSVLFG